MNECIREGIVGRMTEILIQILGFWDFGVFWGVFGFNATYGRFRNIWIFMPHKGYYSLLHLTLSHITMTFTR